MKATSQPRRGGAGRQLPGRPGWTSTAWRRSSSPTIPVVAPLRGDGYEHAGSDYALISLTHLWDWTGFPVAAIPAGVGRSGLPVGVSLIGPAGSDWDLVSLGIALQAELGVPEPPALAAPS